jgi:putative Ca2+/H+ antiporter (TMEM165/GDT1 family)
MSHTAPAWGLLVTVFGAIFVGQLSGKSALAALVLATRYRAFPVLAGAALALATHSAIAVAAGSVLSLLPARPVQVGAGLLFVASAVYMWFRKGDKVTGLGELERSATSMRIFGSSLAMVFVAEWGDLTQIGTATLAARYGRPLLVVLGATCALWSATGIAILVGRGVGHLLRPGLIQKIASIIFVLLGAALIAGII